MVSAMIKRSLLRYLLLSTQQELSTGKSPVNLYPSAGEFRGDPVDIAAYEIDATSLSKLVKRSRLHSSSIGRVNGGADGVCGTAKGAGHQARKDRFKNQAGGA